MNIDSSTKHPDKKMFEGHLKKAHRTGDPVDLYNVGCCYHYGFGTFQDFKKAAKCYRKAIKRRDLLAAKVNLGLLLLYGQGVKQDTLRGLALLKTGADNGYPSAMSAMANVLLHIVKFPDISYDPENGKFWLMKAVEAKDPIAMHNLGIAYSIGLHGLTFDMELAAKWLCEAALLGNETSMQVLSVLFEAYPDLADRVGCKRVNILVSVDAGGPQTQGDGVSS